MNTITIKSVDYPVKMGLNSMRIACRKLSVELDELMDEIKNLNLKKFKISDLDLIAVLLISGIEDGLRKNGKPKDHGLDVDDIIDLIEDEPDQLLKVFTMLGESMPDENAGQSKNLNSRKKRSINA